jgi:hypothetical protein
LTQQIVNALVNGLRWVFKHIHLAILVKINPAFVVDGFFLGGCCKTVAE